MRVSWNFWKWSSVWRRGGAHENYGQDCFLFWTKWYLGKAGKVWTLSWALSLLESGPHRLCWKSWICTYQQISTDSCFSRIFSSVSQLLRVAICTMKKSRRHDIKALKLDRFCTCLEWKNCNWCTHQKMWLFDGRLKKTYWRRDRTRSQIRGQFEGHDPEKIIEPWVFVRLRSGFLQKVDNRLNF